MFPGPARDRAGTRDDPAVVQHQDRNLVGAAQPPYLGAIRGTAAPGPRRRAVTIDPLQFIVMACSVQRLRNLRTGMYDGGDGPENRDSSPRTWPETLSAADVEDHARRLLPRLNLDRAVDAVGDEAALVSAAMQRIESLAVEIRVDDDPGAQHDPDESSAVQRSLRLVLV